MTTSPDTGTSADLEYQARILQAVSRTFALTIPELPDGLREVVGNAYLLCRIADTIEDEPALSLTQKETLSERFIEVVAGRSDAGPFADDLSDVLSPATSEPEQDLAANTDRIIRVTQAFRPAQRTAIERCIRIMSRGMVEFQQDAKTVGLKDVPHLSRYCYVVAGVVAEMLAELFCDHSAVTARRREQLFALAVAYGQGLQMTNILKDIWDDWRHGACWLPRDVFGASGFDLRSLSEPRADPGFEPGLRELVAITHRDLADGLKFILVVPARETGIRRHLLWTLGLSVLMLRRLYTTPSFRERRNVKPSRWSVRVMLFLTRVLAWSDSALKFLFYAASRPLPPAAPSAR